MLPVESQYHTKFQPCILKAKERNSNFFIFHKIYFSQYSHNFATSEISMNVPTKAEQKTLTVLKILAHHPYLQKIYLWFSKKINKKTVEIQPQKNNIRYKTSSTSLLKSWKIVFFSGINQNQNKMNQWIPACGNNGAKHKNQYSRISTTYWTKKFNLTCSRFNALHSLKFATETNQPNAIENKYCKSLIFRCFQK